MQGIDDQGAQGSQLIFIDVLSLLSLVVVLWRWLPSWLLEKDEHPSFHYFDASPLSLRVVDLLQSSLPLQVQRAEYSMVDLKDSSGSWFVPGVWDKDLLELCRDYVARTFLDHSLLRHFQFRFSAQRLQIFLEKRVSLDLMEPMMQIRVVAWMFERCDSRRSEPPVLYLARSPWHRMLLDYAGEHNVRIKVRPRSPEVVERWRSIQKILRRGLLLLKAKPKSSKRVAATETRPEVVEQTTGPLVALPYSGKGLTLDPSRNSDLFWLPFAGLDRGRALVYFFRADDSLDVEKAEWLAREGLSGVALNESAASHGGTWTSQGREALKLRLKLMAYLGGLAARSLWRNPFSCLRLSGYLNLFLREYANWYTFFRNHEIRLYVSFIDWDLARVAMDEAIEHLGGISVSYQRSEESFARIHRASSAHVHFSFSDSNAETERVSGSYVEQFIAAGYVHDHAFAEVRTRSARLRNSLVDRGAQFVVCYFDESSTTDPRNGGSDEYHAENDVYLLREVLADAEFGLILKPKKPSSFVRRMEPHQALLQAAKDTGRCIVLQDGVVATSTLPCEAGLAADVAIGLLFGGTAALECRLAGTATVLLDRENQVSHPLYALKKGRVVFTSMPDLWQTMSAFRRDPAVAPGFGDWMPLIHTLDPFRDGKAAERMGMYIGDLLEGLTEGLPRSQALARARKTYISRWGTDKVIDLQSHWAKGRR